MVVVEHEIAVILHLESGIVASATGVGCPNRPLIFSMVVWVVEYEVSIFLNDQVSMALMYMGFGGPKSVVFTVVEYKVVIFLKNSMELTILTGKALTFVEKFVNFE
jgi:hypothetical protein